MRHNQSRDTARLVCATTAIGHECCWLQPELSHGPLPLHIDVRRFPAVGTEADEIIRPLTKYSRHRATFLGQLLPHWRKDFTQKRAQWLLKPHTLQRSMYAVGMHITEA
jgi:hypothetical protein